MLFFPSYHLRLLCLVQIKQRRDEHEENHCNSCVSWDTWCWWVMGSTSLLSGNAEANKALTVQGIEKKAVGIVNGTVPSVEFDKERTGDVYEVEIITETEEHDLKFNAYTGKLLKQKKEVLDDDDRTIQTGNNTAVNITKEQAIEKALSKAKGTVK